MDRQDRFEGDCLPLPLLPDHVLICGPHPANLHAVALSIVASPASVGNIDLQKAPRAPAASGPQFAKTGIAPPLPGHLSAPIPDAYASKCRPPNSWCI